MMCVVAILSNVDAGNNELSEVRMEWGCRLRLVRQALLLSLDQPFSKDDYLQLLPS